MTAEGTRDGASEQSPLLPKHQDGKPGSSRPRRQSLLTAISTTSIPSVHIPKAHSGRAIVNILSFNVFIVCCGFGTLAIPLTALIEDVVCHQYYNLDRAIVIPANDAASCKDPAVQSRVAYIFASMEVADAVVGLVVAFPWGIVADRIGRRPVFIIGLGGLLLSMVWQIVVLAFPTFFNPNLIVLESLFRVVGGGEGVLLSIISSMLADSIATEQRSAAFARVHVAGMVGTAVAPALTSSIMTTFGPWPTIGVAIACLLVGAITFAFVPESLPQHKSPTSDSSSDPAVINKPSPAWAAPFHQMRRHIIATLSIFNSRSLILLVIGCLITSPLTLAMAQFLVQFVSKRYDIPIARVGYVQAINGVMQGLVALCLLPLLSKAMLSPRMPALFRRNNEQTRDLTLLRWSAAISGIGFLALGLAPTLASFIFATVVLSFGAALSSLLRGIISLYVDPEHTSRLYSIVAMAEILGQVYYSPMLAALFKAGMDLGPVWVGLPYMVTALLCAVTWVLVMVVRVPAQKDGVDDASTDTPHVEETSSLG